jgi:hypothetical protein
VGIGGKMKEAKMTKEEWDEMEFKEWINSDDSLLFIICGNYNQSLYIWLASRRVMREKINEQLRKDGWEEEFEFSTGGKDGGEDKRD